MGVVRQLSGKRQIVPPKSTGAFSGASRLALRKLWCTPPASHGKNGTFQVVGLGLEMRGLAANQNTG